MNLSIELKPQVRMSARMCLILAWSAGVTLAALSGAAACYGWYSLHNPPTIQRVEVVHHAPQNWRNIRQHLTFATQPLPVIEEEIAEEEPPEPEAAAPEAAEEKPVNSDDYSGIEQLPENTRQRLPAIKYSAHIYSSEPGKSVINLNGRDYHEGEDIGSGVTLVTIEPDDSLFSFEGETFRAAALSDW